MDPIAAKVALLVDPDEALLAEVMERIAPEVIQLHGAETPSAVLRIKEQIGGRADLWKALGMANSADVDAAMQYEGLADLLLFDARSPEGADRPGGHGEVFDWRILRSYRGKTPWVLAGGLTGENVGEAIALCAGKIAGRQAIPGFSGVDVSSGVEERIGEKDVEKITQFIYAAKQAYRGTDCNE